MTTRENDMKNYNKEYCKSLGTTYHVALTVLTKRILKIGICNTIMCGSAPRKPSMVSYRYSNLH